MDTQTSTVTELNSNRSIFKRLFKNRTLMLLWGGGTISIVGDCFFNVAVMWMVYTYSQSMLQTAIVQVVWQLDRILFGTIAGVYADRWDRKIIMFVVNILSAIVVGALASVMGWTGHLTVIEVFITIFIINTLGTFFQPASSSIIPEVVDRDILVTAQGFFSTVGNVANFLGSALAGIAISLFGVMWALACDAISFLIAAFCIAIAHFPKRLNTPSTLGDKSPSFIKEIVDGWRVIAGQPIVKAMLWLNVLINVPSYLGPLYPGLVKLQLHSGATAYGVLTACGVIGGAVGGALVGIIERRIGAGRLLSLGWGLAGIATIGIAVSSWLSLTIVMEILIVFGFTIGGTAMGAVIQVLIPENYRGRVWGITSGLSIVFIPISSLIGGWLADIFGPAPLFAFGGIWVTGVACLAWFNIKVRDVRI